MSKDPDAFEWHIKGKHGGFLARLFKVGGKFQEIARRIEEDKHKRKPPKNPRNKKNIRPDF